MRTQFEPEMQIIYILIYTGGYIQKCICVPVLFALTAAEGKIAPERTTSR